MTNNDITGDAIHTRPTTEKYRDNWDKIFGKNPDTIIKDEYGNEDEDDDLAEFFEKDYTETITLCEEDWLFFIETLENPPEPSERLREVFRKYDE